MVEALERIGFAGPIYPNTRLAGRNCYASVRELPHAAAGRRLLLFSQ
jgi:hypothetical protein